MCDVMSRRKRVRGGLLLGLMGMAAVNMVPGQATADPSSPPPSNDPVARFNQLSDQANALNEQINTANVDLASKQALARQASGDVAAAKQTEQQAQAAEDQVRGQVDHVTWASYQGDRFGQLTALLTGSSAKDYLDRASMLQDMASDNAAALNKLSAAVNAANQAERRAQQDLQTAQQATDAAAALKTQLTQQAAALQAQISQLTAAKNKLSASQRAGLNSTGVQGVFIAPAGIRGAAMTIALAQRGKPYLWAAAGPNNFDCSGLVLYAYAQAGRPGLPHSSAIQSTMGVQIARADLQPGDLVFFDNPVGHEGIYVGNGLMVDAPHSGAVVRVEPLFSGYHNAVRLGA